MMKFRTHSKPKLLIPLAMAVLVGLCVALSTCKAAPGKIYYVAPDGMDSNTGTIWFPFRTIQHCLDVVQSGDTCLIRGGTYYESLVLRRSGSVTARITIKNYNGESVSVNSGGSRTLTVSGRLGYYTIEGLSFLTSGSGEQADGNVDLKGNVWAGETAKEGGNDGFVLRDCYVQGTIKFYGHHNLVEGCEVDGMNKKWATGIYDHFGPSHHNTYRNNVIHGFSGRGIWSMSYTENILVENNRVFDCSTMGIDLDGASHAVRNSIVKGNEIANIIGAQGVGILLENAFDCVIEGNLIHDVGHEGIQIFNYGQGCGHWADNEYRDDHTNTVLKNNIIYNVYGGDKGGINAYSVRGIYVYGNTIHNARGGGILLNQHCGWQCQDWIIENNIFTDNDQTIKIYGGTSGLDISHNLYYPASSVSNPGSNSIFSDPQFVNAQNHDFHLQSISPAKDAGATISYLTDDFDGNLRPQGAGFDIGAYEFGGDTNYNHTTRTIHSM